MRVFWGRVGFSIVGWAQYTMSTLVHWNIHLIGVKGSLGDTKSNNAHCFLVKEVTEWIRTENWQWRRNLARINKGYTKLGHRRLPQWTTTNEAYRTYMLSDGSLYAGGTGAEVLNKRRKEQHQTALESRHLCWRDSCDTKALQSQCLADWQAGQANMGLGLT